MQTDQRAVKVHYIVHADGGARGNPGPAAIGVVIAIVNSKNQISKSEEKEKTIIEISTRIGETTNNVAEYQAVIHALSWFIANRDIHDASIELFLDSILVVNQLNGQYKTKDAKLRELLVQVRILEQRLGVPIRYNAVARERNAHADALVNRALDETP